MTQSMLGRYQLVDELGRGGMGIVYKAVDPRLERFVAIKCLSKELADDERKVAAFFREARHAAALSHNNVAQIYNSDECDDQPYLVMEYIEGETLSERLESQGPISPSAALTYTIQAAEALNAALSEQIIHQDVKPSNIMVDRKNRVVLTDFGIARVLVEGQKNAPGKELVGTPGYMAPELYRQTPADHRSDIFSLGMVLFEILVGKPYFPSQAPTLVAKAQADAGFPDLSALPLPEDSMLYAIVRKMLSPTPEQRHTDYASLLKDLHAAQAQYPEEAFQPKETLQPKVTKPSVVSVTPPTPQPPIDSTVLMPQTVAVSSSNTATAATRTIHTAPIHNRKMWMAASMVGLILTAAVAIGRISPDLPNNWISSLRSSNENEPASQALNTQPLNAIPSTVQATAAHTESTDLNPSADTQPHGPSTHTASIPPDNDEGISKGQTVDINPVNDSNHNTEVNTLVPQQTLPLQAEQLLAAQQAQTTEQPDSQPTSGPESLQATVKTPATAVLDRPTGIMVINVGDQALTDPMKATLENGLRARGLDITNAGFVNGSRDYIFDNDIDLAGLSKAATRAGIRYLVIAKAIPVGTQQLQYYGRQTTAYSSQIEISSYDMVEKRQLTNSTPSQVLYTSLNAADKGRQTAEAAIDLIYRQLAGISNG